MSVLKKRTYILTLIGIIVGLIGMMIYNHSAFYMNVTAKMQNMGMGNLSIIANTLERDLSKNISSLQVTAINLEYMLSEDASSDDIEDLLIHQSKEYAKQVNPNFAGIYGILNGEYMHGGGWTPDEGYDPRQRDWYIAAKTAQGKPVIVSPYYDAITHAPVISISQMLSDGDSVISIDISTNELQQILEETCPKDLGYIFLVDKDGLVLSHMNEEENGKNYLTAPETKEIMESILFEGNTYFESVADGVNSQILASKVMSDWHIVMVVDKKTMFRGVNRSLFLNLLLCSAISALIVFFYIYTFRRIRHSVELERESNQKIEEINMNMIHALVRTIDAKDRYTNGHSIRVAEYAMRIARELGKSPEEQQLIYYAGLLHDVGKIRVPEDIINKPGKLTNEEYELIKIHPVTGYHIIKDIYDDKTIALGVKYHHERYDGKGYPSGLTEKNIPEIARILGVADTYDAMASNRSYRRALSQEKVREEIQKGKGTQFDPQIADIMLRLIDADKEYDLKEKASLDKTILVIDDDAMNVKMTELIMKDEPMYKIISASSGKDALELLETTSVDLILLDVEMPDMDGFETLSHIRKKYHMPIAFMTGNKDIETIQKATELGVNDYINKPFIPLALKETIHSIFSA